MPTNATTRSHTHAPPDERNRIRAAMDRILHGRPEHSDGALTIVALSLEAGVPRNALTQRHTDLKNEIYAKVRARGGTPGSERRLRTQVRRLKELRAADAEDIARLKAAVEALVGARTRRQPKTSSFADNSHTAQPSCRLCPHNPNPEPRPDAGSPPHQPARRYAPCRAGDPGRPGCR